MRTNRRWRTLWATGLGLTLSVQTGCQTWMGGMTLPSPRYLDHVPQYFPQEPDFPLTRELAFQEEAAGLLAPQNRAAPGGVVNPVPPGGVPPIVAPGPGGVGIPPR